MKTHNLIIDLRNQLPWHKRYASKTSTAVMWAAWLLLWRPVLIVAGLISLQKHHLIQQLLGAFGLSMEHGVIALLACAMALLLWTNYMPATEVKNSRTKYLSDYAEHFELDAEQIALSRQQKVSVVHHDVQGRIIRIENQDGMLP